MLQDSAKFTKFLTVRFLLANEAPERTFTRPLRRSVSSPPILCALVHPPLPAEAKGPDQMDDPRALLDALRHQRDALAHANPLRLAGPNRAPLSPLHTLDSAYMDYAIGGLDGILADGPTRLGSTAPASDARRRSGLPRARFFALDIGAGYHDGIPGTMSSTVLLNGAPRATACLHPLLEDIACRLVRYDPAVAAKYTPSELARAAGDVLTSAGEVSSQSSRALRDVLATAASAASANYDARGVSSGDDSSGCYVEDLATPSLLPLVVFTGAAAATLLRRRDGMGGGPCTLLVVGRPFMLAVYGGGGARGGKASSVEAPASGIFTDDGTPAAVLLAIRYTAWGIPPEGSTAAAAEEAAEVDSGGAHSHSALHQTHSWAEVFHLGAFSSAASLADAPLLAAEIIRDAAASVVAWGKPLVNSYPPRDHRLPIVANDTPRFSSPLPIASTHLYSWGHPASAGALLGRCVAQQLDGGGTSQSSDDAQAISASPTTSPTREDSAPPPPHTAPTSLARGSNGVQRPLPLHFPASIPSPVVCPASSPLGPWRVVSVSCSWYHTVALTDVGTVYTWGAGTDGALGHGDEVACLAPRMVQFFGLLHPLRATAVAAGADASGAHTLVVARGLTVEEQALDPRQQQGETEGMDGWERGGGARENGGTTTSTSSSPLSSSHTWGRPLTDGATALTGGRVFAFGLRTATGTAGAPTPSSPLPSYSTPAQSSALPPSVVATPLLVPCPAADMYHPRHGGVVTVAAGGGFSLALTASGAA